jgi:hypothetical protein
MSDTYDCSTPLHPFACCDESTPFVVHPEWVPFDETAKAWANFSLQVKNALALQAVGSAFLALSFETSAHEHHALAYHDLWRRTPTAVSQDIAEAILDLREACQQWTYAFGWLERFANEECHAEELLTTVRDLFGQIQQQQQRLWLLLSRLQEEQCAGHGEPFVVHLGCLSPSTDKGG